MGVVMGELYGDVVYNLLMNEYDWYAQLSKPVWSPPAEIFGLVWIVLYALIAFSFGKVFYMAWRREVPGYVVWPFVLNLVFNAAFTPLQFGLKSNLLAAADILLVLGTLVWGMAAIYSYRRYLVYLQIPYLLWVGFATFLQLTITYLNR
ncbi:MAG: TspO and MBR like protein [Parcubacteria group bacterium GW2011_GWA2_45_14]|nr:MAG: TspO and MBR like protein [Parcubacteria group bacterium GW2011_GWA2_45_14]